MRCASELDALISFDPPVGIGIDVRMRERARRIPPTGFREPQTAPWGMRYAAVAGPAGNGGDLYFAPGSHARWS